MQKTLNLLVSLLFLASTPALAAGGSNKTGLPDEYGSVFTEGNEYSGGKRYSHADWTTVFGRPELRLASDLVSKSNPLISAAVIDGRDYIIFQHPVEEIQFTYRKNIEKEADPVLRTLREDGSVQTIYVQDKDMKLEPSPGNYKVATYKVPAGSNVKLFAILAQAHKKNNDGCNFEVVGIRWKFDGGWYEPNKDLKIRVLEHSSNGELDKIYTDLYR